MPASTQTSAPREPFWQNKNVFLLSPGIALATPRPAGKPQSPGPEVNLSYHAPELIAGNPATVATDIYAVGVTLYRLLTGKYPYGKFDAKRRDWGKFISPARYRADVPPWLVALLQTACALEPAERFQDTADFAQTITANQPPAGVGKKSVPVPAGNSPARRWKLYAMATVAAGLLIYLAFNLA